ncbi:hypothetical protein GGC03_06175 [Vibrio sp. THAF191c]|nr:hypothetical protein FIU99_06160 [Vibrio sp. THAF64]QGM33906.1 hypothetical protein GGC04_06170 [Vibrio sp. THAF191d]QGN69408.1 hypothetical protein GGC03_06175 [Vibrio sp. THAF191c]
MFFGVNCKKYLSEDNYMHQLKKYGAIGGAIALALCWPLAVGQIGQNVIHDGITHLSNDSVKAEVVSYNRGYLSSEVQTRYTVADPELASQLEIDGLPTEFVVNSHVTHGLFSLKAESTLENAEQFPLTMTTVTQLNGNTDYSLELGNWHQTTEGDGGAMVSVTPSSLKGHVTVLGEVSYDLNIPSVEVDFDTGEKMLLSNITGSGLGRKQNSFWLGDQKINIAEVSVLDSTQAPLFSLKSGQYQFASSLDDASQRVNSKHVVSVDKLLMSEDEVDNLVLDLEFGDLDSSSFEHLVSMYQNNPVLTADDIQDAIPYVETLFSKGFYLSMNKMALTLGDNGEFESTWKITVPEGTTNVTQNPANILPSLTGNLDTFFSNGLVEQYPFIKQGVDEAMVMEFVSQNDKGYQIQAELKDGNLVFENGQQIPLMAILLPAMMQP